MLAAATSTTRFRFVLNHSVIYRFLFRRMNSKSGHCHRLFFCEVFCVHNHTITRSVNLSNQKKQQNVFVKKTVFLGDLFFVHNIHRKHSVPVYLTSSRMPHRRNAVDVVSRRYLVAAIARPIIKFVRRRRRK